MARVMGTNETASKIAEVMADIDPRKTTQDWRETFRSTEESQSDHPIHDLVVLQCPDGRRSRLLALLTSESTHDINETVWFSDDRSCLCATPLHLAVVARDAEMVKILLSHADCDPNALSYDTILRSNNNAFGTEVSPLVAATKMVAGAEIMKQQNPSLPTRIHRLVRDRARRILALLLGHGAYPQRILNGRNALHESAAVGSNMAVEMLLAYEKRLAECLDYDLNTPLQVAIYFDKFDTALKLLNHMKEETGGCPGLNNVNSSGQTALDMIRSINDSTSRSLHILEEGLISQGALSKELMIFYGQQHAEELNRRRYIKLPDTWKDVWISAQQVRWHSFVQFSMLFPEFMWEPRSCSRMAMGTPAHGGKVAVLSGGVSTPWTVAAGMKVEPGLYNLVLQVGLTSEHDIPGRPFGVKIAVIDSSVRPSGAGYYRTAGPALDLLRVACSSDDILASGRMRTINFGSFKIAELGYYIIKVTRCAQWDEDTPSWDAWQPVDTELRFPEVARTPTPPGLVRRIFATSIY
jgi:ankyrin repeat protein